MVTKNTSYFLHEKQDAKIRFVNSFQKDQFLKGKVDTIADSFLVINGQKIFYSSITRIPFNKNNNEKQIIQNGIYAFIPPAIGALLISSSAILKVGHGLSPLIILGAILITTTFPVALIGTGLIIFRKKNFYVLQNNSSSKNIYKMSVIHPSLIK
jgi:hypothetical protein